MILGLTDTEFYVIVAIVGTSLLFYAKTKYKGMLLAGCYKAIEYLKKVEEVAPEGGELLAHGQVLIKDFADMISDNKITTMELMKLSKDVKDVMEHISPYIKKLKTA